MAANGDGALAFRDVSKQFGAVRALADCSFSVTRGRMLGFLGPNVPGHNADTASPLSLERRRPAVAGLRRLRAKAKAAAGSSSPLNDWP
jgi:ATPase subunit of ABC transporter with duplicated ATPase domains